MKAHTNDKGSLAPKERVNIVYRPHDANEHDELELPLKLLVLGAFRHAPDPLPLDEREIVAVDKRNFNSVMRAQRLVLTLPVPGIQTGAAPSSQLLSPTLTGSAAEASSAAPALAASSSIETVQLKIHSVQDFEPDAIVAQIPYLHRLVRLRGALYHSKKTGAALPHVAHDSAEYAALPEAFLLALASKKATLRNALIDACIASIDQALALKLNTILHHPDFQQLERAWRSLHFLVLRVDTSQNIRLQFLNVSKQELQDDFEDTPEIIKSGLYRHVYTAEYGQFGGKPYGALIGNYEFGPSMRDIRLLQQIAAVAAQAHAPFLAGADKSFFGIEDWSALPNLKDIRSVFEMPQYAHWHTFRASEDARYIALCLPGFLLRAPYGCDSAPAGSFMFREQTLRETDCCWGNTAFALAHCFAASFASYRWCVNIIGTEGGGLVDKLPSFMFEATGRMQTRISTRMIVSEQREYELTEAGFISLSVRPGTDSAVFFAANSVQAPKTYMDNSIEREAAMNFRLSTQLPYMMIMNRLAHYIKVIQRENIGAWKERRDLEKELNKWISQYVTEMDNPDMTTRSRRPLRLAQIEVNEVPANPGWYSVTLKARPHFKYMGASFTLALVGKLDRE